MKKIIYILAFFSSLLVNRSAFAIWPDYTPLLPMAPQLCFQCTPATISTLTTTISQVEQIRQNFNGANLMTMVTQAAKGYAVDLGKSKFNALRQSLSKRKKVVSYSRTIEDSHRTVADKIEDEGKVQEAFIKLFLQYPSKNGNVKSRYDVNARQLKMDSTMEMYITAREMNKELRTMLAQLDNIEKCLVAGQDCSEEGLEEYNCQKEGKEDKVCLWRNALTAVRIYDKIMRYTLFLNAMNAQYDAIKNINGNAQVLEYDAAENASGEKKSSSAEIYLNSETNVASYHEITTIASASTDDSLFDDLSGAGLQSPVEGKEAEFESLEIISDANDNLNQAVIAHNYKQLLPKYKEVFKTYNEMLAHHARAEQYLNESQSCVIGYLSRYYKDGSEAWTGEKFVKATAIKTAETKNGTLYKASSSSDKGIRAWLMKLYEEFQTEESNEQEDVYEATTSKDQDDSIYMSEEIDQSVTQTASLDDMNKKEKAAYQKDSEGKNVKNYKKPSIEDDMYAEARKNALVNWTIGAEISAKINSDAIRGKSDFGAMTGKRDVWNDQKHFYDAYLSGKYENMKNYVDETHLLSLLLSNATLFNDKRQYKDITDDSGKIVKTAAQQKQENKNSINKLRSLIKTGPTTEEIDKLLEEEQKSLDNLTNMYRASLKSLQNSKRSIYAKMDTDSATLSDTRDELNAHNDVIGDTEVSNPKSEDALEYGRTLERGSTVSLMRKTFSTSIKDSEEKRAESLKQRTILAAKTSGLEKSIDNGRAKLENIDKQIKELQAKYIKDYSAAQNKYKQSIDKAVADYAGKMTAYKAAIKLIFEKTPILSSIHNIVAAASTQAQSKIDEAYNNIKSKGDLIYLPDDESVVKTHNELLADLRKIDVSGSATGSLFFAEAMQDVFAKIAGEDKEHADSDYFVGIVEKERDFTAPKNSTLQAAPMREIFHFDTDDYDAVLKYKKGGVDSNPENVVDITLAGPSFSESGLEIPEIWQKVLKPRPFVEKELNLEKFLTGYKSSHVFWSAGLYPCKIDHEKYIVSFDDQYFLSKSLPYSKNCVNLFFEKIKRKPAVIDIEANEGQILNTKILDPQSWSEASELGQIVQIVEENAISLGKLGVLKVKKLTFNPAFNAAVVTLRKAATNAAKDGKADLHLDYYIANRAMFETNQFGDYLDNWENEKTLAEVVAQQRLQVEDVKNNLRKMFEDLGYTLSEDFNLINDADYKKAEDTLKEHKIGNLRRLKELIENINGTAEIVNTNKKRLLHGVAVLEKDNEEKVQISAEEDLDELEEKIKTSEANEAVLNVYDKEGQKSLDNQLLKMHSPYCAVYP
ncbi:MAG: hypothetical protein MSB80_03565 [Alphaproteobacteria bacterium]|nr:hypothetical protein [Alphaproteobacteria bacterium]